jgi:hypothetical protein
MSSDYSKSWPYIPPNLTHFALDDYRKCSRFLVGVLDFRKKLLRRSGLDVSVVPRPLLEPMRHGAVPVQGLSASKAGLGSLIAAAQARTRRTASGWSSTAATL